MTRIGKVGGRGVLVLLLGAGLVVPLSSVAQAAILGPDSFGYTADTSAPPSFEDISGTGNAILANSDDASTQIPIGFDFPFYNRVFDQVFVSSNGVLSFDAGNFSFSNTNLNVAPPPTPTIAPFWDDLETGPGLCPGADQVYVQTLSGPGGQRLVVQWNEVEHFFCSPDPFTFEVALFDNGDIEFRYDDLTTSVKAQDDGGEATVGISAGSSAGAPGNGQTLQVSFDTASLSTGNAILYSAPPLSFQTLTVIVEGLGQVAGPGITCPGDCVETYVNRPLVTLDASSIAPVTYQGCDTVNADLCGVQMDTDRFVHALFGSVPPEEGGIHRANVHLSLHSRIKHGMLWLYGHVGSHRARCRQDVEVELLRGGGAYLATTHANAQGDFAYDPFDIRNPDASIIVWAHTDRTRFCQPANSSAISVPTFTVP